MSKSGERKSINEGLSSEILEKGLSTANLANALNKKPASSNQSPGQSSGDKPSPEETNKQDD